MRRFNQPARITLALILGVSVLNAGDEPQLKPRHWNFDKDKVGEIAADFVAESGQWKVVEDDTAPTKKQVLAQLASSEKSAFNIAFVKDSSAKHVDVQVKFRTVAGDIDQGGGLVWRAKDARNYYLCRYNPLEDNLRIYKVVDGQRTVLESLDIAHKDGWHSLRVTMRDEGITYHYDDIPLGYLTNDAIRDAGMVGLWTKADARTHFDDFVFIPLP